MTKAEGIIIRTTDYGENNKIVTLYTSEFGKIGLMARGAKKPKSMLSSISHVFFYGLCLFNKGRGLGSLYQAESINPFRLILSDIEKTGYAALIVELTDRLTEDSQPFPGLYRLLRDTLLLIEKGTDAAILASIFAVKMMKVAGIDPEVDHCLRCGNEAGPFKFSLSGGGILCRNCEASDPYALPMTPSVARLLPLFKKIPLNRIGNISVRQETIGEIESIIAAYYERNAGIRLRAWRFIEQLSHFRAKE
ncbi:DNA repair protein RecO [Sporolactobacillus shoreae]|uniref:DNA repair protein RecO n=1 Tax=Sporolactobacillus shoreae TaxID=1465501 RepID=A0A4Z0GTP9_9BACL|nr:DNA repair protein RecO [Sporolactobacillus shoreae]TGA99636.1 DNA repair protein RecO [Sporolactobacillus shoreae]